MIGANFSDLHKLGFSYQETVRVRGWLPDGAEVLLLADRFYPSAKLFAGLRQYGWHCRLRVKGNLSVDPEFGDIVTTGELARGFTERDVPNVRLFANEVPTNLVNRHETGHDEPWIIAMDCRPTQVAVRDYESRWGIEPTFSDFKSRGFQVEATHLQALDRLDHLLLIMVLALHWCVRTGQADARNYPTPLKKLKIQTDLDHWIFTKLSRSALSWFKRGLRILLRRLQTQQPLPSFYRVCTVLRN